MKRRSTFLARLAFGILFGTQFFAVSVGADAVPPPPTNCPRGQVGVTGHGGPRCVDPAPKDCPAGWRGQLGGTCALDVCFNDAQCGDGKECRETDLCLQEFIIEWGYGQNEESRVRPLFAGPPMHFDPPRHEIRPVAVCGNGLSCPLAAKCGKGKLCLQKGVARPGVWPKDAGKSAGPPKK